jgi:hypothetical protein
MNKTITIKMIYGETLEFNTNILLCDFIMKITKAKEKGDIFFVLNDEYRLIDDIQLIKYKEEQQ